MLYGGIRKGYPILRKYSRLVANYAQLIRPFTLVAPIVVGIVGTLLPIVYELGYFPAGFVLDHIATFIYIVLVLVCVQAGGQVINQVTDIEIDMINKPYRPLIKEKGISKTVAAVLGFVLVLSSVIFAYLLNPTCFALSIIGALLAIYYSVEPIRAKRRNWRISLAWQAAARGFLPFLMTWSIFGNLGERLPWLLAICGFLWVLAFQGTKDFADYIGDYKFNIRTIVVVYGYKGAREKISWLGLLAVWSTLILWDISFCFALLTLVLAIFRKAIMYSLSKSIEIEKFENNLAWMLFYIGLGFLYIITFVILLL